MTLFEKILAIMSDVQYLAKDDKVEFGKTSYKALSEEKVTSIMRAELLKHRVVVFPISQVASREGTITHVDVIYKMVNVDDPNDYIEIASCGDGADTQDKGSGKAMTYAFKYMWLRTFALPTGEDPDKISSEELDAEEKKSKKEEKKEHVCSVCGEPIKDGKRPSGSVWKASDIAEYTQRRYGKKMCASCGAEEAKKENKNE
jgi:ribosomal protein L34E